MPSPCPLDALVVESVRFASGPYRLEGELAYPEEGPPVGAAVIAGPHPLLGGHMGNNVVRGLGDGLARRGFATLRFNYRAGPAADAGEQLARFWATSRGPDEDGHRIDLAAALDYLRSAVGDELPLALVGYSYGCSLLATSPLAPVLRGEGPGVRGKANPPPSPLSPTSGERGARRTAPLVLVAPTVGTHEYGAFEGVTSPKLVVAPEGDFAADAARLARWFGALPEPKKLVRPRLDGHFFRGHEDWLAALAAAFIDRHRG